MTLRRLLVSFFVMAILCLLCIPVLSENAIFSGDTRLDQKVTLDAESDTVASVLDKLSASSGVTLSAGLDSKDWFVQDRKVVVHVTDMKLSELMETLSSILRFHWSKGVADGKPTYKLWQDKTELAEEESLRNAGDTAQSQEARNKRENAIADMVNLGSLSSVDSASLKASDPWRYVLATEPLGRDVANLMSNLPEARGAFVQGTEASFPVVELSQQMQEAVRRIAQSYDSLTKSIGASEDHAALLAKFEKLQVTVNRRTLALTPGDALMNNSILGRITIGTGTDSFDIPLFDPSSAIGKALGKAIISLKGGTSKEQVGKQLESDMTAAQRASQSTQAAARDISSDPALRARVLLFKDSATATLPIALKALAINSRMNIVSDYFPGAAPVVQPGEKTLGEQLEAIRTAYGSNWTKAGNTITFVDKDWFIKRTWAVPDVWMKYWVDRGKLNSGFLIEDMVQIGNLRDEQIDHTIMTDATMVRLGAGEAARNRLLLRFYANLAPDQVKQMTSGRLEASSLSDGQWSLLKMALATKGAAYAAVQRGSQTIQMTQSAKDAVELSYTFAYNPGGNDAPVTFKLTSGVIFSGFMQKSNDPRATTAK